MRWVISARSLGVGGGSGNSSISGGTGSVSGGSGAIGSGNSSISSGSLGGGGSLGGRGSLGGGGSLGGVGGTPCSSTLITSVSWNPHEPLSLCCGMGNGAVTLWRLGLGELTQGQRLGGLAQGQGRDGSGGTFGTSGGTNGGTSGATSNGGMVGRSVLVKRVVDTIGTFNHTEAARWVTPLRLIHVY